MIAITASSLFTPTEQIDEPIVFVEDGVIAEITSKTLREIPRNCRVAEYANAVLAPGFIDIHVHGAAGHDVMEPSPDAMPCIEKFLGKHGVSSYLPTTVTASVENTIAALHRLADAIEHAEDLPPKPSRARPAGIHLEGPFISHARSGVHPLQDLIPPSIETFERFWEASRGHIRVITIAPELEGAIEFIQLAASRGICASLGHSDADYDTAYAAVDAGARHATHLFNAMRPLNHRDPGIVGEALTDPRISVEIIADKIHLAPSIVKLTVAAKGKNNVILITDGTAATGMPDGRYRLGNFEFDVKDGVCLSDGKLAGSTLTMDRALRNAMQFAELSLQEAAILATLNPGRVLAFPGAGKLTEGAKADMVVLSRSGELQKTIIGGAGI